MSSIYIHLICVYSLKWTSMYARIGHWRNYQPVSLRETIKKSSFLKQNAIFFIGTLLVSILNYLYYPVLGRLLSLSEYGEVQILVSLFLQLIIFMSVLGQVTVNVVANTTDANQRNKIIFELQKFAFILGFALLIIGSALSWQIQTILQFDSPLPFIVLLIAIIATIPLTFQTSYLRGEKKFGAIVLANIIGASTKIVLSAAFVIFGWGTAGAIGGLVAAQLIACLYALVQARKLGLKNSDLSKPLWSLPDMKVIWPELKFGSFVFIVSLGVTVLSSIDTIIVKAFFDPEIAGGYAGVSTVAKIIFFLTASIAQVMLPSIKLQATKRENRQFLLKSFILLIALGGATLGVFCMFPLFIMNTLMGSSFAPYAHILPILSTALFGVSIINLIVSYYIGLRRHQIAFIVTGGVVFTLGLLVFNHTSLDLVAINLLHGSIAMLSAFILWRICNELITRRRRII